MANPRGCALTSLVVACSAETLTRTPDSGKSLTPSGHRPAHDVSAFAGGNWGPEGCLAGDQVITARDNPNTFDPSVDGNLDGIICSTGTSLYDNKAPGGPDGKGPPRCPEGCLVGDQVITARDNPNIFDASVDRNLDGTICQSATGFYDNKAPGGKDGKGPPRGPEGCLVGDQVITSRDNPNTFDPSVDLNRDGTICQGYTGVYDNKAPGGPDGKGPSYGHEGCVTGDRVVTVRDDPLLFDSTYDLNQDGTICLGYSGFYDNRKTYNGF